MKRNKEMITMTTIYESNSSNSGSDDNDGDNTPS